MTHKGNGLPMSHLIPAFDQQFAIECIGRNPSISVANQYELSIALQFVACIGNNAIRGSFHDSAFGRCNVDSSLTPNPEDLNR